MGEIYPDKKYFIREEVKGKKKTTVYAIRNEDSEGITIQTVVENIDSDSDSSPEVKEKYYPGMRLITNNKIDGKRVYQITGGI